MTFVRGRGSVGDVIANGFNLDSPVGSHLASTARLRAPAHEPTYWLQPDVTDQSDCGGGGGGPGLEDSVLRCLPVNSASSRDCRCRTKNPVRRPREKADADR